MEGSGRDLIQDTNPAFAKGTEENHEKRKLVLSVLMSKFEIRTSRPPKYAARVPSPINKAHIE
jgi:hypothetical protein